MRRMNFNARTKGQRFNEAVMLIRGNREGKSIPFHVSLSSDQGNPHLAHSFRSIAVALQQMLFKADYRKGCALRQVDQCAAVGGHGNNAE